MAFAEALVLACIAALAVSTCPLTAPCNCDPLEGFRAFNRTCVKAGYPESTCEAALASAAINVTMLQLFQTRVASDEVCDRSRAAAASCVSIPMALADQTLLFCTGEVFSTSGDIIVKAVIVVLVWACIPVGLCFVAYFIVMCFGIGLKCYEAGKAACAACATCALNRAAPKDDLTASDLELDML